MRQLALIAIMGVLVPPPAFAGSGGARPLGFLSLDTGARPTALGGAYGAMASDVHAVRYNPAGLGRLTEHEASFMDNQHFEGVSHQSAAFASRTGWGAGIDHVTYGSIPRTTISSPDGTLGDFGARDLALTVGHGRRIHEGLHAGGALRVIRSTIDDITASGYSADLGVLYEIPGFKGFEVAAVLGNLGPSIRYEGGSESLPMLVRLGSAYRIVIAGRPSAFALDLTKQSESGFDAHLGAEMVFQRRMALRLGYNTRNDTGVGIRFGFGWKFNRYAIDYAFVPTGSLGSSHRISIGMKWAKPLPKQVVKPKVEETELKAAPGVRDRELVRVAERLGRIAYSRGRYREARGHYREAIKIGLRLGVSDTSVAEAYAGIGLCLLEQGEEREARKFFLKSLEIGPSLKTLMVIQKSLPSP